MAKRQFTTRTSSRLEVAKCQLETAITLWFQHGDIHSIQALAENAHEILAAAGVRRGIKPGLNLNTLSHTAKRRFLKVKNSLKHGTGNPDERTLYIAEHGELLMMDAAHQYLDLVGSTPDLMLGFLMYFWANNPRFYEANLLANEVDLYRCKELTREEFFRTIIDNTFVRPDGPSEI